MKTRTSLILSQVFYKEIHWSPYLLIICLDCILRMSIDLMKENGFTLEKVRSRRYPAQTITDMDCTGDIVLLENTPTQDKLLLHSLEQEAGSIGLHVKAEKAEYMCFNLRRNISILNGDSLKLMDTFTFLGSSVLSTENDINARLAKAWTAVDRLLVIWKSNLSDKIKRIFSQAAVVSILLYGCTTWTLTKRLEKKLDGNCTRMLQAVLNKSSKQHPMKQQLYDHLSPISKTIQIRQTRHAGHCWKSKDELINNPFTRRSRFYMTS